MQQRKRKEEDQTSQAAGEPSAALAASAAAKGVAGRNSLCTLLQNSRLRQRGADAARAQKDCQHDPGHTVCGAQ